MNWGHNFPKSTYPKREKQEVKTFDIKTYVNAKREEKINKMLSEGPSNDMPLPFGGMSGMPGGMPGGMPMNPFLGMDAPKSSQPSSFDVDDLVKRIDAKIA